MARFKHTLKESEKGENLMRTALAAAADAVTAAIAASARLGAPSYTVKPNPPRNEADAEEIAKNAYDYVHACVSVAQHRIFDNLDKDVCECTKALDDVKSLEIAIVHAVAIATLCSKEALRLNNV